MLRLIRMKQINVFVSYAHRDHRLVQAMMRDLRDHLRCCVTHKFDVWQDTRILCGTGWDAAIQRALRRADVGLLLVSPAFRCSDYITTQELPALLAKKCLAVGVKPVCFKTQLDPALAAMQFHRHQTPAGKPLCWSECATPQQKDAFVMELYQQMLGRL